MARARVHVHPDAHRRRGRAAVAALAAATLSLASVAVAGAAGAAPRANDHRFFHGPFLTSLSGFTQIGSTVPSNGDLNPYGIATVRRSVGLLVRGDTLISNFNNAANGSSGNQQGTGTTIVELDAKGNLTLFTQLDPNLAGCPGGVGLTTALAILPHGDVVVGSLPTGSGSPMAGCLIVLNAEGQVLTTWSGGDINGPWDLTARSYGNFAQLFVTNVLNGPVNDTTPTPDGTVVRLNVRVGIHGVPRILSSTVVGSGFDEQLNSAALVLGPTGVAFGRHQTLYVADTVNSRIAAIPRAAFRHDAIGNGGITVSSGGGLNAPLGLMSAPNGSVIAANGNDGNAVEVSPDGTQVVAQLDPGNAGGDLFGLTLSPSGRGILFVDDGNNTLQLLGS
jgi:hypothetical protein